MAKYTIELSDYELGMLKQALNDCLNYCSDEVEAPEEYTDYLVSAIGLTRELLPDEGASWWAQHILDDSAERAEFSDEALKYFHKQAGEED